MPSRIDDGVCVYQIQFPIAEKPLWEGTPRSKGHKHERTQSKVASFAPDLFSTDAMAEERLAELQGMCV